MKALMAIAFMLCAGELAVAQPLPHIRADFDAVALKARASLMSNPQSSLVASSHLLDKASRITASQTHARAILIASWIGSEALLSLNRPAQALNMVKHALEYVETAQSPALLAQLLLAEGGSSYQLGNVKQALIDYQAAFHIFDRLSLVREKSIALQNIGTVYQNAGDYTAALKYAVEANEIYNADPALLVTAYNNIGNSLIELGRAKEAVIEYDKAARAAIVTKNVLYETRILQNLARAETESGDYSAADATLARAFSLAKSGPAVSWRPALYGVAAALALRQHDLDKAAVLIDRTFEGAKDAQAAMPMRDFHRTAYEIFRQRGDTAKALAHLEAFKELDDDARAVAASASAALMTARFDFANQDAKIKTLQLSRERVQTRLRTTIIGGLLAAATVISTLLAFGFVSIRRSRNQVRAANDELTTTNTALEKALAAKGEFLATTSHEIRTPLNGILGMTQVILADRTVSDPLRTRIELVHGAGETMRALVDDILDVAKMETGELRIFPAEMNLKRLLEDAATVWAGQAQTKNVALEVDLDGCPDGIVADEVRLRQIVFNLMSNAIKFTDRGRVRLVAATRVAEGRERLSIGVVDSGIGIPPDRMGDIFESFRQVDGGTTRRHGGTGLGLAICRNLARAMGGDVTVASTLGTGSTFTLDLPLQRTEGPQRRAATHVAATRLGAATLLVLDANPLAQGIMRALLAPHVEAVRIASQLDEAMEAVSAGGIDHVVADGVTIGLDVAAAGRIAEAARDGGARLTLLWPRPDAAMIEQLRGAGIEHVLAKPLPAADLLAALQIVYGDAAASRAVAASRRNGERASI